MTANVPLSLGTKEEQQDTASSQVIVRVKRLS